MHRSSENLQKVVDDPRETDIDKKAVFKQVIEDRKSKPGAMFTNLIWSQWDRPLLFDKFMRVWTGSLVVVAPIVLVSSIGLLGYYATVKNDPVVAQKEAFAALVQAATEGGNVEEVFAAQRHKIPEVNRQAVHAAVAEVKLHPTNRTVGDMLSLFEKLSAQTSAQHEKKSVLAKIKSFFSSRQQTV